jgi:hypothetical protein
MLDIEAGCFILEINLAPLLLEYSATAFNSSGYYGSIVPWRLGSGDDRSPCRCVTLVLSLEASSGQDFC